MVIDVAKYSFNGGHEVNEDSIFCGSNVFVVADGLGGHSDGEVASAAAVEHIRKNFTGDISNESIASIINGANKAVCELANGSHTTVAAAFLNNDTMRYINVGDSRVYIFRHNMVYAITKDHSVCQASVDIGEMSFEDIRFSEDRSRLLKVLGTDADLVTKNNCNTVELCDGDAFLICSDGFWEYVHEREMEADLLKSESADEWARYMLKRHILKAHNEGDNYSLICGIVHSDKAAPPMQPKAPVRTNAEFPNTVKIDESAPKEAFVPSAPTDPDTRNTKLLPIILAAVSVILVVVALVLILSGRDKSTSDEDELFEASVTTTVSEDSATSSDQLVTDTTDITSDDIINNSIDDETTIEDAEETDGEDTGETLEEEIGETTVGSDEETDGEDTGETTVSETEETTEAPEDITGDDPDGDDIIVVEL